MATMPRSPWAAAADLLDPPAHPYLHDPVGYARDVMGFTAWSKQREILESVRDQPATAVRACHGVGKTMTAAQCALWFLDTHKNSRVITTAPTWAQVEQLLWREIRAAVGTAHGHDRALHLPAPTSTKLEVGDQWFAIGQSTDRPERFQGHHADHLLLIVDEASGVAEAIFEAAEGFRTAEGAKLLLIGNPTRVGGQFYRAFTQELAAWSTIHISVYDSPNYTREHLELPDEVCRKLPRAGWAEEKRKQWGEDSPMFQVRVLGNFSKTSDRNVIDLGAVEFAQQREILADPATDLIVIGCDVARFGSDETVIVERVGQRVRIVETYVGNPTTHTAARVRHHAEKHPAVATRIVVDDTGVGGGVTDQLRAAGLRVTGFNAGEKAHRPLKYPNRRSELWFEMAAQLEDLDLDPDDQLAADLTGPMFRHDEKQRRVVESKDKMRERIGRSPDRADGVMLTLVPEQAVGAVVSPTAAPKRTANSPLARHSKPPSSLSDDDLMTRPM